MNESKDVPRRPRKVRDRAFVLVLVGVLLLMPPFATTFQSEGRFLGLPATLVCVFVVWAGLILGARLLARPLTRENLRNERS